MGQTTEENRARALAALRAFVDAADELDAAWDGAARILEVGYPSFMPPSLEEARYDFARWAEAVRDAAGANGGE